MITLGSILSFSEIGQKSNQEDYLYPATPDPSDRIHILCDGMGGHQCGEVASSTVAESLGNALGTAAAEDRDITAGDFSRALTRAYDALDRIETDDTPRKPGTTLACLCLNGSSYLAAHIGDSRIYHIRPSLFDAESGNSGILYRSEDHSLVRELVKAGQITEEEARRHPRRNIITRAMQPAPARRCQPTVHTSADIRPGDYFFLCSDGVLEQLTDRNLCDILATPGISDREKTDLILDRCMNCTRDNFTGRLIHVADVTLPSRRRRSHVWLWDLMLFLLAAVAAAAAAWHFGLIRPQTSANETIPAPAVYNASQADTPVIDTIILRNTLPYINNKPLKTSPR